MKSISQSLRKKLFISSLFLILSVSNASAQIDPFDPDVDDETAPQAPIDGFITVGLLAGAALGIRKLKKAEQA